MVSLVFLEPHLDPVFRWIPHQRLMERRRDFYNAFLQAKEFILREKPDIVLFPGDFFYRVRPRIPPIARVVGDLREIRRAGVRIYAITGHHDQPRGIVSGASPLAILHNAGCLHFFKPYDRLSMHHFEVDGVDVCVAGISYNPALEPGQDPLEGINARLDGQVNILMLHHNIEGFTPPPHSTQEPVVRLTSIPEDVHLVAAGHLHRYQHKTVGQTTICYCGSTERITFAEEGEPKGFVYAEVDREGVQQLEHIKTETRPMKTVDVSIPKQGDATKNILKQLESFFSQWNFAVPPLIRVRLNGTFTRPVLRTYRRDLIIAYMLERCLAVKLDEENVSYAGVQHEIEVQLETPIRQLERYAEKLLKKAKGEERELLEKALKYGKRALMEAGAW